MVRPPLDSNEMQSDPRDRPEPDPGPRGSPPVPWWFVVAGFVFLGVLAPLVPDEPMHLSGVMVVLGLASAALALLSGIAFGIGGEGDDRRSGWAAAACGLLLAVGWLAWWVAKAVSEVS